MLTLKDKEDLIKDLKYFSGLEKDQAKIYLGLLRFREFEVASLPVKLDMDKDTTYRTLIKLESLGLVSNACSNRKKICKVLHPQEAFLEMVHKKRDKMIILRKLVNRLTTVFEEGRNLNLDNSKTDSFSTIQGSKDMHVKSGKNSLSCKPPRLPFIFLRVDLNLVVTDPKNMMTHHMWIWNIQNITDRENDQVSFILGGDVPKDIKDLNIVVRDKDNKKLKICSINYNNPLNKQFVVKLNKPLSPKKTGSCVKLEYDWEEPKREYHYTLAADCKKFKFSLTMPKGLEIEPKIFRFDPCTKLKFLIPTPDIVMNNKKTKLVWRAKNLKAFEMYKFEW